MDSFFSFGCVGFGFELGPVRFALRDAGAHMPRRARQARLSGAECGYLRHGRIPGLKRDPRGRFFVFGGAKPQFETVLRTVGEAESGSHTPLEDRQARLSGAECGYLRHRRIPGLSVEFIIKAFDMFRNPVWIPFSFLWMCRLWI